MKKILIRADDLGYSRSVNYGIFDAVHFGIVNNVGIMTNMPTTPYALDLLKDEKIDLGMHTNISNGRPVLNPTQVPSLVEADGTFKKSHVYRKNTKLNKPDFVNLDEVVAEIEAQYQRFLKLVGKKPDYFEGHAVMSSNFRTGLKIVADKYNLPFLDFPVSDSISFKKDTHFKPYMGGYKDGKVDPDYKPFELLKTAIAQEEKDVIPMFISHAGYLDDYLLQHSSLTIPRVKEAACWIDHQTKDYIIKNEIKLIRYSECD